MNTENNEPRKYKRYDDSFKRSAVELWLQGGKSIEQIAHELGISTQSLKQWRKQLAALPATGLADCRNILFFNQRINRPTPVNIAAWSDNCLCLTR